VVDTSRSNNIRRPHSQWLLLILSSYFSKGILKSLILTMLCCAGKHLLGRSHFHPPQVLLLLLPYWKLQLTWYYKLQFKCAEVGLFGGGVLGFVV